MIKCHEQIKQSEPSCIKYYNLGHLLVDFSIYETLIVLVQINITQAYDICCVLLETDNGAILAYYLYYKYLLSDEK